MSDTPANSSTDSGAPTRRADADELPSGNAPSDDVRHAVGDVIGGRYRIESVLGEGAMGTVYLAEHTAMRKTVAVKSLRRRFTKREEYLERFRREAQAAANIEHRNICQATDFIDARDNNQASEQEAAGGSVYLVMEFLQGRTLTEVIESEGPLAPTRAVDFAGQMFDGLAAAHRKGVVHRDLKPDNIMLIVPESDGEPGDGPAELGEPTIKLMDFGIARVRMDDDAETLTRAGEVYGTPHYMSPEQAAGDEVDRRADLYATGVILFEMLAGEPPFDDDRMSKVMSMHVTKKPPAIADRSPHQLSEEFQQFIDSLLAKSAEDRFESADAARERLNEIDPEGRSTTTFDRVTNSVRAIFSADSDDSDSQPTTSASRGAIGGVRRAQTLITESLTELLDGYRQLGASSRSMLRWVALGGGLAAAVTLSVVLYFVLRSPAPDPGPTGVAIDKARASWVASNDIDLGDNGELDRSEAAGVLDSLERGSGSAHSGFLRGRAHRLRGETTEALEAYRMAVSVDPRYFSVDTLLHDVIDFARRDGETSDAARSLLTDYLSNRYLLGHLGETAYLGDHSGRRDLAFSLMSEHGAFGDLPEWMRVSIEMRRASDCSTWKRQIGRLVTIGEPRGAEILEWYADQPPRGCGFLKTKDCYACIREELSQAIDSFE